MIKEQCVHYKQNSVTHLRCPFIKTCSDVTFNLSSDYSMYVHADKQRKLLADINISLPNGM